MPSEYFKNIRYHPYPYNSKKTNCFTYNSTHYNKFSCRNCGAKIIVIRKCIVCKEPILWHCENCDISYDSIHHQHSYIETSVDRF